MNLYYPNNPDILYSRGFTEEEVVGRNLQQVIQAIRESGRVPGTLSDVLTEEQWNVPDYPKTWPRRGQE